MGNTQKFELSARRREKSERKKARHDARMQKSHERDRVWQKGKQQ